MKKTFLALSACALLLTSCGGGKLSVTEYNEKAMAIYNPFQMRMNNVADAMDGNNEEVAAALEAMSRSVDSVHTEISKLQPGEDAQEMHNSMMQLLDFEKNKMMPTLKSTFAKGADPEKMEAAAAEINALTEEATVLENKMLATQQAMAAKAGASLH